MGKNGMLSKRKSMQWFDPKAARFLPDRFVRGTCPKCGDENAYSDECDKCGAQYEPSELISPRSAVSDATPEMRETTHLFLDMWQVSEPMRTWIEGKSKTWRTAVLAEVLDRVRPAIRFDRDLEEKYLALKAALPKHKRKYAAGGQVLVQFGTKADLETGRAHLSDNDIPSELADEWAHRPITRDIAWGIPVDGDPELAGKTLYVWPDSLIAPIAFSQLALEKQGRSAGELDDFWRAPGARITQFLGQDNVYFYVLMQGAMWLGAQEDPQAQPAPGDLQLTDVVGCYHLMVGGEKMSKSRGNFFTGNQLLDEKGYTADQIRYYLAILGLAEKTSDFDIEKLEERNRFLAGPLNAAFERPISAAHSKFDGKVPEGELMEKADIATIRMVQRYVKSMERSDYPNLIFEIENYARTINSLFTQFKPHDDRHDEKLRKDALYSSFYVLKNLMIMLYPFVPGTMDRLRQALNLPVDVFAIDNLGTPIPAGHAVGQQQKYFPEINDA